MGDRNEEPTPDRDPREAMRQRLEWLRTPPPPPRYPDPRSARSARKLARQDDNDD